MPIFAAEVANFNFRVLLKMFSTNTELQSFVTKFHELRRAGLEAHLNLHARGGRYWVGLCAQLGEAEQQPQQKPRLRRSPAYARRQERRRAAREAAAEAIPTSDVPAEEAKTDDDMETSSNAEVDS